MHDVEQVGVRVEVDAFDFFDALLDERMQAERAFHPPTVRARRPERTERRMLNNVFTVRPLELKALPLKRAS